MDYEKSIARTFELLDTVDIKELIFNDFRFSTDELKGFEEFKK